LFYKNEKISEEKLLREIFFMMRGFWGEIFKLNELNEFQVFKSTKFERFGLLLHWKITLQLR
jgi:hypothetical protein